MELFDAHSEITLKRFNSFIDRVRRIFGDKGISLYSFGNNNDLNIVIMCGGKGLLIKNDGTTIKFIKSSSGLLGKLERDEFIVKPKIEFVEDDEFKITTPVSLKDKFGNELSVCILPSYSDKGYPKRVCYTQNNKKKDLYCEINYETLDEDKIYPGLLTKPESVHIISQVNTKGITCSPGFVPKRMQMYSRTTVSSDTLNYLFMSFNEHGVIKTLRKGSYELFNGEGYITRYCRLSFMNSARELVELPWPFSDYKKEEEILAMIRECGFYDNVPPELINLYNDTDIDVNTVQEFLKNLEKFNQKKLRKYIKLG